MTNSDKNKCLKPLFIALLRQRVSRQFFSSLLDVFMPQCAASESSVVIGDFIEQSHMSGAWAGIPRLMELTLQWTSLCLSYSTGRGSGGKKDIQRTSWGGDSELATLPPLNSIGQNKLQGHVKERVNKEWAGPVMSGAKGIETGRLPTVAINAACLPQWVSKSE